MVFAVKPDKADGLLHAEDVLLRRLGCQVVEGQVAEHCAQTRVLQDGVLHYLLAQSSAFIINKNGKQAIAISMSSHTVRCSTQVDDQPEPQSRIPQEQAKNEASAATTKAQAAAHDAGKALSDKAGDAKASVRPCHPPCTALPTTPLQVQQQGQHATDKAHSAAEDASNTAQAKAEDLKQSAKETAHDLGNKVGMPA